MLRSLYAGVTGLTGNIVELDVVGNNIANINTIGFKSGRVTFQEILTQNLRPATRPTTGGGLGGTNPQQIGLGTVVGSIDSEFTQGNIRTTGNKTDLAIQGDGFFIMNDGTSQYYTRAGNFTFDGDNYLVSAATGMRVQGVVADSFGNFSASAVTDIQIDPSTVVPARATESINVFGNLSSASEATGTHMLTNGPLLAQAEDTDDLRFLHNGSTGQALQLTRGDIISLTGTIGGVPLADLQFEVGEADANFTVQELTGWMQTELSTAAGGPVTVNLNAGGFVEITNSSGQVLENVRLNLGGGVHFNQVMLFSDQIDPLSSSTSAHSLLSPATADNALSDIYNSSADSLNFVFQDDGSGRMVTSVEIGGTLGSEGISSNVMEIEDGVTTLGELLDRMTQALSISNEEGISVAENGRIQVTGDVGVSNSIGNISLLEPGNLFSNLNASMDFGVISAAEDAKTYAVTSVIYDSLGDPHNLTLAFTKRTGFNTWDWEASLDGDEEIVTGGSGTVSFDEEGSLVSFLYTDGGGQITIRPQTTGQQGAGLMTIAIDPGDIGGVTGLTQFEPEDQIQSYAGGFTVGRLVDFDIDQRGVVVGRFSNDTVRDMARLGVARFNNPNGLEARSGTVFASTEDTGEVLLNEAGIGAAGKIAPAAIERSTVDLATEFTKMIETQRAYSASTRVVTASYEMLQEITNATR